MIQQTARHNIQISALSGDQHDAWLPLWRGYQAFYKVDIPADVSAVTWSRLLDPAEPMGAALAWDGPRQNFPRCFPTSPSNRSDRDRTRGTP